MTQDRREDVMAVGFVAMIAGMLWYTQIPVTARTGRDLLPGYLLIGFALPFTFIPVSIAALAGVEHREAGLASGLINTAQQIGGAIGVAVCSSVLFTHSNNLLKQGEQFPRRSRAAPVGLLGDGRRLLAGLVATLTLIRREELGDGRGSRRGCVARARPAVRSGRSSGRGPH